MTDDKFFEDLALVPDYLVPGFFYKQNFNQAIRMGFGILCCIFVPIVFAALPLLLVIPVVVTVVRIAVVFVLPFVFVAVVAPWSEYQRAGLKIMLMADPAKILSQFFQ